jgi:hypothetical protein
VVDAPVVAVDFESYYAKGCDIKSLGPWHYLNDPRCDIYLMGVAGDGVEWAGHPKDFDWSLLHGKFIVAHNLSWDGLVLAKLARDGVIPAGIEFAGGGCTANLSVYLGAPRNLAGAARELLGVDVTKDLRTWMKGRTWQDAVDAGRADEMRDYVIRDARTCFDLWQKHSHEWPENERELAHLTMTSGWRGVRIDTELADQAVASLDLVMWQARNDIPWADGDAAVLSIKSLGEHCRANSIPPPPSTSEDDPACAAWENIHGEKFPWVAAMRTFRKTNALREKLRVMKDRIRPTDGCMGFGLKYFGAHTGRWSGDSGFNCLTGDHEVLTPEGWVRLDAWDESLSPIMQWEDTGRLSFVRAGKVSRAHTGTMVVVDNVRVRMVATPDHRVVHFNSKRQITERPAQTLITSRMGSIPTGGIFDENELSRTDSELRFLVALAADGHVNLKGQVSFGFKKARKIQRFRTILAEVGCVYRETVASNGATYFYIKKSDKPDWMSKGYSEWLLELSHRQAQIMLEELPHWDGTLHEVSGATVFFTARRDQAEWVTTIAHLHGRDVSMNRYRNRWDVYFKKQGSNSSVDPRHDIAEVCFTGTVFCPQVPSGMFLVRYRDRIHVTGNCQNLPRGESYGADLRGCIVPRPGKEFIICDLSQIEPRVLAWLCGDTVLLDQLADGIPLYEAHARATMGWTGGNLKKENAELYSLAKARVLGLGYGCGPERFVEVARTMAGITISSQEATRTVESFRGSNRKITALWNQLQNDFKRSSGGDFVVELPSGRKLTYRDVRSSGGWTARVERGSRRIPFYGGKLCENCLGEGTEVLTNSGWMPIEQVGQDDLVWDGVEWVTHSGVVEQGDRETIDFGGVRVTPDHKVLTRAGWLASAETTHQEAAEYYAEA